jgi:hypothetical protein
LREPRLQAVDVGNDDPTGLSALAAIEQVTESAVLRPLRARNVFLADNFTQRLTDSLRGLLDRLALLRRRRVPLALAAA